MYQFVNLRCAYTLKYTQTLCRLGKHVYLTKHAMQANMYLLLTMKNYRAKTGKNAMLRSMTSQGHHRSDIKWLHV